MIKILGVRIDTEKRQEMLSLMLSWLNGDKNRYVVTPNPEIILKAQHDEEYFYVLGQADLSIPDGFGLVIAAALAGQKLERLTGSDTTTHLLKEAEAKGLRVAIFVWDKGLSSSDDIRQALTVNYPRLNYDIYAMANNHLASFDEVRLSSFAPSLALVTLGAPSQEKFMYHRLRRFPGLRLSIGIGGSLDFLTGKVKRSPIWLRHLGLEWLWRLMQQPAKRIKRIYNAVIVFGFKVLVWRFVRPWQYRDNIACLAYRNNNGVIEVLMVEREDMAHHWQFPQGGTDGQSFEEAAKRELSEELNLDSDKFVIKKIYPKIFRYENNDSRPYGYRGQKQGLAIIEFTGQDNDIKINFWEHRAWKFVPVTEAAKQLHSLRMVSGELFLSKLNEFLSMTSGR